MINFKLLKLCCTFKPMYAQINETDLDHTYTEHVEIFWCGYLFYKAMIEFYENVEYKGAFFSITKKQYIERKAENITRDYVAEAYENGNPYNVREG